MSETRESVEPRGSPYFGLDYYEEKFGAWFFGRETEGSKIITNLRAARLTLLHAESGVGKSSLLRAGVAWRMRKLADDSLARRGTARSVPIVFSSWKDDPVVELAGTIRAAIRPYMAGRSEPELQTDHLDATIGAASDAANASLLIMLDQFEEYFLYRSREPTPERFADELARCINRTDLRANFLIAIREDAYAGLGDLFKGRIANVYGNYLHVDYLDRASAEKAIREPLGIYNSQPDVSEHITIQDELVEAVLDQVRAFDDDDARQRRAAGANGGGGDRVATPLLQLVMETVWQRERGEGSHELRLSTLEELRGVRMIVDAHLGKALSALGGGERQTAIDMFDHLVTPSGGKIAESVPDLAQRTGLSEDQVGSVLEKLDHARIVRPVPAPPGQDPIRFRRYEIFHDVLGPTINRAITAREERRRARRLRRLAALAVGLLVIMFAVVGVFAYLLNSANNEKMIAESRQLAADAFSNAASDPELSTALALQALHLHYTSQAEDALRTVLPTVQAVRTFLDGTTVYSAAFDPANANLVASADRYGLVKIWDVRTGHSLRSLSQGGFSVTGGALTVSFNSSGTQIAVGYGDGRVAVFDARTGQKLWSATVPGSPAVNDIVFVASTGWLATATEQGLAMCQPKNGSKCFMSSSEAATSIAENPRNWPEFVAASASGTVIWTITGSLQQRSLSQLPVNDAEFSPDGSQVATAGGDGMVRVYDVATGKAVMTLDAGEAEASSVAFSPDGTQIVVGYSSGRARVWDTSTGLQLTLLAGDTGGVLKAGFNAGSSEVVTASEDGTIRVWYSQPRELQREFTDSYAGGTATPLTGTAFISGSRITALGSAGHVYVFTTTGSQRTVVNPGSVADDAVWNDAGTEFVTVDSGGTVDLWHAVGSTFARTALQSPMSFKQPVQGVSMSADGSRIAIVTSEYTIQVRSAQTGDLVRTLTAVNALTDTAISPTGRQIFGTDDSGQVEVWSAATGHRTGLLSTPGTSIIDISFDESGSEFATGSNSGVVTVWAGSDDRQLRSFDACPSPQVALSPDGSKIVVACGDGTAPVFNAATGQLLTVLPATNAGAVNFAAFSLDGKRIITTVDTAGTGCVQIWNAELANPWLPTVERFAEQRITMQLTTAELQKYLAGTSV